MISTTIPVTIEPDAAEQIDKLGLRREFEQMRDHVLRTIPELLRLSVSFTSNYEMQMDWVTLEALGPWRGEQLRQLGDDYTQWVWQTFPPEVHIHFILSLCPV
jgi:hypothetical protein